MSLTLGWSSSQNFVPKSMDKTNKNPLIKWKKCCLDGLVMLVTDLTSSLGPWTYHKEATNYFYISFWRMWGALGGTFVVSTYPSVWFIFGPPFVDGTLLLEVPPLFFHSRSQCLCWNLALEQIREYVHVVKVFAPLAPTLAFSETIAFL